MINPYALDFLRRNCGVMVPGFVVRKQSEHDDLTETLYRRGLMRRRIYGRSDRARLVLCVPTKRGRRFVRATPASTDAAFRT